MLTPENLIVRQRAEVSTLALRAMSDKGAAFAEVAAGSTPSTVQHTTPLPASSSEGTSNGEGDGWRLGDAMDVILA